MSDSYSLAEPLVKRSAQQHKRKFGKRVQRLARTFHICFILEISNHCQLPSRATRLQLHAKLSTRMLVNHCIIIPRLITIGVQKSHWQAMENRGVFLELRVAVTRKAARKYYCTHNAETGQGNEKKVLLPALFFGAPSRPLGTNTLRLISPVVTSDSFKTSFCLMSHDWGRSFPLKNRNLCTHQLRKCRRFLSFR